MSADARPGEIIRISNVFDLTGEHWEACSGLRKEV